MQTTLNFRFPSQRQQQQRDVAVRVVIPIPEQRPMATANYLFMCTGELPSSDVLSALGVPSTKIMTLSAESLRNSGLKPFAESSVVRIEKNVMVELGSSTTKTIFGGFIEDEPLKYESQKQQQLCAGTVLIGNVGIPNSNASRYYILLNDVTEPTQCEELGVYQSIGHITVGLNELREACGTAAVHSRTLAPQPPVKLWVSDVQFDYSKPVKSTTHITAEQRPSRTGIALSSSSTTTTTTRTAGRVRRREETEAEDAEMDNAAEVSGFFHLTRSYPAPQNNHNNNNNNSKGIGPQAKRLRSERFTGSDGESVLAGITAVPPVEGEAFDFFAAQEEVFLTDVGMIKETQTLRRNRRGKPPQKMRQKHDKINRLVMTGNSKGGRTASAGTKKTLRRRY
ncbi:Cyclophilin-type peptidyl-prolyl cis-trans isomerase domain [Trypanosoma melophagium]|uniref:Cyclophilin-type peptidyl-prolyl cis-trans isomerase domain n=1 Tax=Trypanosoma melophagium TaxID=715481 RepID=UPI00351A6676|nr:Cyclophilin-type peptidyl-prolyl cis-trans isomerase domain [Trypanosoma melophagium]